jgi:leucyl/phenylalanyl-tRNA--protein transferase
VECWQEGKLVGGVYGVHVGGVFAGESMFHRVSNASKVALFHLMQRLRDQDFRLFDIQQVTSATQAVGAREIPRSEYLRRLAAAVDLPCQFPGGTTAALDGVSSP